MDIINKIDIEVNLSEINKFCKITNNFIIMIIISLFELILNVESIS